MHALPQTPNPKPMAFGAESAGRKRIHAHGFMQSGEGTKGLGRLVKTRGLPSKQIGTTGV